MRKSLGVVALGMALSLLAPTTVALADVTTAGLSDSHGSSKKVCNQTALANYRAYYEARRAIMAAYQTVVAAAKSTYDQAKESGTPSQRKAARAAYLAAVDAAKRSRDAALAALGPAPAFPPYCHK